MSVATAAAERPADMSAAPADRPVPRYPKGVKYIIGNEGCERFSFYGMKAILWVYMSSLFMAQELGLAPGTLDLASIPEALRKASEAKATGRVHLFIAGVYAFPMIGALIADRLLGKYRTILYLSLVYCAGHGVLALGGASEEALYLGLALIAIGSGGIKPCVSANVGDQFDASNAELVPSIYQAFYFIINFGSFFSTLLTPWLYKHYGPDVAFGVPGVLMAIATFVFWLGRNRFVKVAPRPGGTLGLLDTLASIALFMVPGSLFFTSRLDGVLPKVSVALAALAVWFVLFTLRQRRAEDSGFLSLLVYCSRNQAKRGPGIGFFDVARERFGEEAAEGPPAVLRIIGVFAMVSVFWALFDQHSSSWINQASKMNLEVDLPLLGHRTLLASQIAALNPFMVMLIIPFLRFAIFGPLEKRGVKVVALRKMTVGMFLAAVSFVIVALLQAQMDLLALSGAKVSVLWQVLPYFVITVAEVLVSATGLEFAYSHAPRAMKSTIMGFWLLSVTVGNLLVAFLSGFKDLSLVNFFWVFGGLMGVAAVTFSIVAFFFKGKMYLQEAAH